jgi:hypothetical protein
LLKTVVDFTGAKLQKPLNQFIRAIQNAKSSITTAGKDGKKDGKGKENNGNEGLTVSKVLRCARMVPNLVFLIEQYEQQLKLLNKHFTNVCVFVYFCF